MKNINTILMAFMLLIFKTSYAQQQKTDANIFGHIVCEDCDQHLSFANIVVKGTTIGTTTDETGHYQLINLPEGTYSIEANYLGYKPKIKTITIKKGESKELNFELEADLLGLEEIVVTGDRNKTDRRKSSSIVSRLTPKIFSRTQSVTLSEGLNYTPGLRMENNCQNCGFSQVRMNGMEGPYSQILINSRPIFSGLAGVYGLELIPSNMIEKVEVIRGGGSALYGSNAIAGTINLILKDPIRNTYELGINSGLVGIGTNTDTPAQDYSLNMNTSLISDDSKTGLALYAFYRDKTPYDANNDSFSELSSIKNTTIGTRFYHRFGTRSKIIADFFNIKEERRGGNRFDYPLHEAEIAEAVDHNITTGAITYKKFFREDDTFSIFASGQNVGRNSYYGAERSLSSYGETKDFSFNTGIQYNAKFKKSNLSVGIENNGAFLKDKKLGFPDYENATIINDSITDVPHTENAIIANQITNTLGVFSQYEINIKNFKISAGARYDNYNINDRNSSPNETGNVVSPRLALKYDLSEYLQTRISFSQGYRAPQIFDEDLHIETSGSRKVIHQNSPNLTQETSNSLMASFDFNKEFKVFNFGFLAEVFYTKLNNPFANEYSESDENGTVIYTRINAEKGATVQGVNIEMNIIPSMFLSFKTGYTIQKSMFEEAQEFNEKQFLRTPNQYGFFTANWDIRKNLGLSTTGNYTGKMLVPYFGMTIPKPEEGELRKSSAFFDWGFKVRYKVKLNGASIQFYSGIKNILNSYQSDFDTGINRDPGYIYGPSSPRTIYFGIKLGNAIK